MSRIAAKTALRRLDFEFIDTGGGNTAWWARDATADVYINTDQYGEEAPMAYRDPAFIMVFSSDDPTDDYTDHFGGSLDEVIEGLKRWKKSGAALDQVIEYM